MTIDAAGLAASAWSLTVQGSCQPDPDGRPVTDVESMLYGQLDSVLGNPLYGVTRSEFAGQVKAGTPGLPEPEPEPALPTLSAEAQITALTEQLNEAHAALANLPALVAAELAKQAAGGTR